MCSPAPQNSKHIFSELEGQTTRTKKLNKHEPSSEYPQDIGLIPYPGDLVSSVHSDSRGCSSKGRHHQTLCHEPGNDLFQTEHRGVQMRLDSAKAQNGFSNLGLQPRQGGDRSLAREVADLWEVEAVALKGVEAAKAACDPFRSPCSCRIEY